MKKKEDFTKHNMLNKKLDMTIELLCHDNTCKKIGNFEVLVFLGVDLSSKTRKKTGHSILFPSFFWHTHELKNFNELLKEEQEFVRITLEEL